MSHKYAYMFGALLVLAVIFCMVRLLARRKYPYASKYLLTKREYKFYLLLKREADRHHCLICPKVGLKDLMEVTVTRNYLHYFYKISQKHVDFVICDQKLHVIFAIELDDSSHCTRDAQKRDHFKNRAFKAARIPLIRVWDIDELTVRKIFSQFF